MSWTFIVSLFVAFLLGRFSAPRQHGRFDSLREAEKDAQEYLEAHQVEEEQRVIEQFSKRRKGLYR